MKPQAVLGLAMFNQSDFYGMDHPDYLDVFVEICEDRDRITDLLANAILQSKTSTADEFREFVFTCLGNMGFDCEEEALYEKFYRLIDWVATRLSRMLPDGNMELVEAIEDADWVNVVYRQYLEPEHANQNCLPV